MPAELERVNRVLDTLFERYAHECFTDEPFRVLVSTILSQRTTDANTHTAARRLLSEYSSAHELAMADVAHVEELIRAAGMFRIKARRLIEVAQILVSEYGGNVPDTEEGLLSLPGVGRKTANCVLAYGFGRDAIAVDTHVHRISNRLGIVSSSTPEQTERQLVERVQRRYWRCYNIVFVRFGQTICRPTRPRCGVCPVESMCPSSTTLDFV